MGLFGKKNPKIPSGGKINDNEDAKILVLGGGCAKCDALEDATKEALKSLEIDEKVGHIRDYAAIASYGVMGTPALVVDGKVVSVGRVLTAKEVEEILKATKG